MNDEPFVRALSAGCALGILTGMGAVALGTGDLALALAGLILLVLLVTKPGY